MRWGKIRTILIFGGWLAALVFGSDHKDSICLCQFHYSSVTLSEGENQLPLIAESSVRAARRHEEEPLRGIAAAASILDVEKILPGEKAGESEIEAQAMDDGVGRVAGAHILVGELTD